LWDSPFVVEWLRTFRQDFKIATNNVKHHILLEVGEADLVTELVASTNISHPLATDDCPHALMLFPGIRPSLPDGAAGVNVPCIRIADGTNTTLLSEHHRRINWMNNFVSVQK